MTADQIRAKKAKAISQTTVVHDTAVKVRELLDKARKSYGDDEWDDNGTESHVMDLIVDEAAS